MGYSIEESYSDDYNEIDRVINIYEDKNGFIYGRLKKITYETFQTKDLKKIKRNEAYDDYAKKIFKFQFEFLTEFNNGTINISHITGTLFNNKTMNNTYKSRGNKVYNNVYNLLTNMCLKLELLTVEELNNKEINLKDVMINRLLIDYQKRDVKDQILIRCKLRDDTKNHFHSIDEFTIEKITELPKI